MGTYNGSEPYVFVSYCHKDSEQVLPVIQGLQDQGFRVWYDEGIEVSMAWAKYVGERLEQCSCMLAYVTGNFDDSDNCWQELNFAMEEKKQIVAIRAAGSRKLSAGMRMRLGALQTMPFEKYGSVDKILETLSQAAVMQPCLGAVSVPASTPNPAPEKPAEPSAEELFEQGLAYYAKNENEDAVRLFRQAADQGHATAQVYLGISYQYGVGVDENPDEAMRWYRTAAEQGGAAEQSILAARYDNGDCVQRDVREAAKWWRKAAEQGYAPAQYYLGNCYWYGSGVRKNRAEARKWYQKAADQGYEDAIGTLEWQ